MHRCCRILCSSQGTRCLIKAQSSKRVAARTIPPTLAKAARHRESAHLPRVNAVSAGPPDTCTSQPGEDVSQGWSLVLWRLGLQVLPAVAEQGLGDGTLYPNRDQGPPPLGPSISGASLEGARCLTGLQGDKLAYESYGIVAPLAVGFFGFALHCPHQSQTEQAPNVDSVRP